MIELIYNEEENSVENEKLAEPKNIRQIGEPREYKKIFVEDYVHTFLAQCCVNAAVLLGKSKRSGGKRYFYVTGAVATEGVEEKQGKYQFLDPIWNNVYEEIDKFFPEQEVMGWYLACPGLVMSKLAVLEETHRTYFSGADKILFFRDTVEGENCFYGFDGNRFTRQSGYYIYYEKNDEMREYILSRKEEEQDGGSKERPDIAMANFRKILREKTEKNERRKKRVVSYGKKVSIALIAFVLFVSVKNRIEPEMFADHQVGNRLAEEMSEALSEQVIIEELPGEIEEETKKEELPVTEIQEEVETTPLEEETIEETEKKVTEEAASTEAHKSYEVQPGDTLSLISRKIYGSDEKIEEILKLNEISDGDYIQAGEIILLP